MEGSDDINNSFQLKAKVKEETMGNVLGMLITQKYGIPLPQFVELYNAYCGYDAFPSSFERNIAGIKKFLYLHRDIIEVCEPVPAGLENHREVVLNRLGFHSNVRGKEFQGPLSVVSTLIDMEDKTWGFVD